MSASGSGGRDRNWGKRNAAVIALGKSGMLRKPVCVAYGPTEDEAFAEEDRLIALYGRP
jgi:hypothetical protein